MHTSRTDPGLPSLPLLPGSLRGGIRESVDAGITAQKSTSGAFHKEKLLLGTGASRASASPAQEHQECTPGTVPESHPCQVRPTQGKSPLLLPPHLLGISPTQPGRPPCPLRSGLQPQGQPSTHGRHWHSQQWCRTGLPAIHTPRSLLCVLLCSSLPSSPGRVCLKSHSLRHHRLLKGEHQAHFGQVAQKPSSSPVKQSLYSMHSQRLRHAGGGAGTKPPFPILAANR